MVDLCCRLCLNTDPFLSFSPIEGCLDLVTFTLGSLALAINPTLSTAPSLLCKACEAILLDFQAYKSTVQANIQFVIDNKEKIKTRGLISVLSTKNTLKKAKGTSPDIKSDCNEENVTTEMEEENEEQLEVEAKEEEIESDGDCEIPDYHSDNEDSFEVDAKDDDYEEDIDPRQRPRKRSPRKKAVSVPGFCDECNRDYVNIKQHRYDMHPKEPRPTLTCSLCKKVFYGPKNLASHIRTHNQPVVPCPKCGKQIKESAFDKHLKYTHKEKPDIPCTFPDCDQMFKQPQTLKNHIRKVHEKEKSLCINCGETVSHLYQHKLVCCPDEKTVKNLTCSFCQKTFSSRAQREQHEKIVHGSAKICPICGKKVKWLESHMKNKHTERDKPHMCADEDCEKSFKTSAELKNHHVAIHQKLRSQCPQCDKWFTVHHLATHMKRVHS